MDELNSLMENMQLPHELCVRLREYMHECKKTQQAVNHQRLLEENLSEGLQVEVAKIANDELLCSVYWAQQLQEPARFEICRALRPQFFAPNEELRKQFSLIMVRSGICAARGLVLVRGDVWGHENILLQSEYLKDTAYLRTLTFMETLTLTQADLRSIIAKFPVDDARLRRVQVRLALYRAFLLAATAKKMGKPFSVMAHPLAQRAFSHSIKPVEVANEDNMTRSRSMTLSPIKRE